MPISSTNALNQETIDECLVLQQEESEVLESIYPEYVTSSLNEGYLKLEIPVEFEEPREIVIKTDGPNEHSPTASEVTVSVSSLPSLLLHVSLPQGYPLHDAPQIVSIRATHLWLPRVGVLSKHLTEMWQAGDGVLYMWAECLRTGEFLTSLDLAADEESSVELVHPNPPSLAPLLVAHDQRSQLSQFSKDTYPCSVCLTTLKGSKCLRLSCQHIFCRECLQDFWGLCIREGDVSRVGCPDPECVKEKREADEEEVARVVLDEEVERWRWLLEKRDLDRDPTVVHCPVETCQSPVRRPTTEDPESGWARFRQCSKCHFTFCAFCRRTWHGAITPCVIAYSEKVVLEYLACDEGSEERERIERRYGANNIARLVKRYNEETANNEWLRQSTTECPGCMCRVEKNLGCNHMTCWKCGKHFCYRCGAAISGKDPYIHFSTPGPCYQKLFEYTAEDLDWEPVEGFA